MVAKQKTLLLESYQLRSMLRTAKTKALDFKGDSFVNLLVEGCKSIGRIDVVERAQAEAMQALTRAGLMPAYQVKTKTARA